MLIERSARVFTVVVVAAALLDTLGSPVLLDTCAVFAIVALGAVLASTWTVNTKVAEALTFILARVQEIVPVPPTEGVEQAKPAPPVRDTNLVFAGSVSVITTLVALLGPELVTMIV